jgi:hypothetical protein
MRKLIALATFMACGIVVRAEAQPADDAATSEVVSPETDPAATESPTTEASVPPAPEQNVTSAATGEPPSEALAEAPAEAEAEKPWMFTAGVDIYSRFIWRGVSFGEQWTIQPNASFTTHGFGLYAWASAAPNQGSLVDFIGLTASYAYTGEWGTVGADLADWIYTSRYLADGTVDTGAPFITDFDDDGTGSHWLDLTGYYIGPAAFPIKVQFGAIVYADPDHSLYAGLSYPVSVGRGFTLTPELGMVFGQSRFWYRTDDDPVNVTNCALTLARTVTAGHGVSFPLNVALIVNPESERVHFVVGAGVRY